MPECTNPLWPCAMTGAAAALSGFDGITVVIHGSSGCYYYPATLLHTPLQGTFIMEDEVIFGSEERLLKVIRDVSAPGKKVAVVMTCVPSVIGEDVRGMLASHDVILVDSPGISGGFESGYRTALLSLEPRVDDKKTGINIDGSSLLDPFSRGNVRELSRLLTSAGVAVATVFCADTLSRVSHASPFTIGTNSDLASGVGRTLGGTLGLHELRTTFEKIGDVKGGADIGPVLQEIAKKEEHVIQVCDKYLRRFDPPHAVIFGWASYAAFAASALTSYLDAEISCIGTRTPILPELPFRVEHVDSFARVQELISEYGPDLVIGSSFEQSVNRQTAFFGLTPPLRGRVRLTSPPLAGIEGTLHFMEGVLNACMNRNRDRHLPASG
jgi:nitrogenase molybdenum-iron protein alpha/beta subunit